MCLSQGFGLVAVGPAVPGAQRRAAEAWLPGEEL